MGEKMGPNTLAAFHAGADFMAAKMAEEQDSSDDEALLAGAPLESYGQARMAELREAAERRNKPPGAVLVDPTAWRRLVVDARPSGPPIQRRAAYFSFLVVFVVPPCAPGRRTPSGRRLTKPRRRSTRLLPRASLA